ncbi:MAG: hypothetical protein L6R39_005988 [Caloplaca ligustica]|nr:MAG: hypothetical protein L6R39_005988 [Caloplaca ligustica]
MASASPFDTHLLDQKVKTLVNAQLKSILKKEKLAISGLKAVLQNRIIDQLHTYAKNRDSDRFNRLRGFINNPDGLQSPAPSFHLSHTPNPDLSLGGGQKSVLPPIMPPGNAAPIKPLFKESPFYTILQPLTDVHECRVRESTRDQVECRITLQPDIADKLAADSSFRVLLFCASEPISHFTKVDIAFPHQVEIKVNLDEVKANLRGLKNKPGSTRPPDITNLLRKRAHYDNSLSLTYALTHKKFYFVVNLVKRHSVDELVSRLQSGKTISKDQVIRESKRLDFPLRAVAYESVEQAPTWTCPVCNKMVSFEALEIDLYLDDILKATPKFVDQVTIQPDGQWSRIAEDDHSPGQSSSEDDEDLVEIKDPPRVAAVKNEVANGSGYMRTPPASSREQSSSSVPPPSTGTKRSAGAVIDLTSDDDEDGQRSSKRPAIPTYPSNRAYHRSESVTPGTGDSAPFRSYITHPLSKSNLIHGGYPRPP